jgi:S-DNA-T family DNA segregation ATPase FtsK/SpoIIIE
MKKKNLKAEILAIFFLFLGAFIFLSLISYHYSDPSFFSKSTHKPFNYGGRIGANLAEILIQFLGLSSFIFSLLCIFFSFKLFKEEKFSKNLSYFFWILIAVFSSSTFLNLEIEQVSFGGTKISSGGILGNQISLFLKNWLNHTGSLLFTFFIFITSLLFTTPLSAKTLFSFTTKLIKFSFLFLIYSLQIIFKGIKKLISIVLEAYYELKNKKKLIKNLEPIIEAEILSTTTKNPVKAQNEKLKEIEPVFETQPQQEMLPIEKTEEKAKSKKETKQAPKKLKQDKFILPDLNLLDSLPSQDLQIDKNKLQENSKLLTQTLSNFGIEASVERVKPGPVITMYEVRPGSGVKVSKFENLSDDIALALAAQSIRVIAPIPGKSVVGIEIPNEVREKVFLKELLSFSSFQNSTHLIPIAIGKDISGTPIISDLAKMPHLLVAGSTGSGKSVFINSLLCSLLYKFSPHDLKLIMCDPKVVELKLYEKIPHLMLPIVDDPRKASTALKWAVNEMERRYRIMSQCSVKHIISYNEKLEQLGVEKMRSILCPQDESGNPLPNSLAHLFEHDEKGLPKIEKCPYIVIIIDEFADLMAVAKKDVEESVLRLAAKARAAGIHLVIATQRPSVDVVTGVLKANLQSRIAFKVASKVDSRTILDSIGAEKLLGQGDMLFVPPNSPTMMRVHGAYVSEDEVMRVCEHWSSQATPEFKEEILEEKDTNSDSINDGDDELYNEAVAFVRQLGKASASMLQRRFKIGYNRAARLIETMEAQGIVGPAEGAKPREVLQ